MKPQFRSPATAPTALAPTPAPPATRREFLQLVATFGAGLFLALHATGAESFLPAGTTQDEARRGDDLVPNSYLIITPQGRIIIYAPNPEIGQGISTALPMLVADELDADWRSVTVEMAPIDSQRFGWQGTGGSLGVLTSWHPLRKAGAQARAMLVAAAAARWQVAPAECVSAAGAVHHPGKNLRATYGELASEAAKLPIPADPPLKVASQFKIIGTPQRKIEAEAIVHGRLHYGIDQQFPDLLHASIERCPHLGGTLKSCDATAALAQPGVIKVVPIPVITGEPQTRAGIAVIATSTWAAMQARSYLKIEWAAPPKPESNAILDEAFTAALARPGKVICAEGDVSAALATAPQLVEATFDFPFLAHMTMEPMNCTARIHDDACEIWAPAQQPPVIIRETAKLLGLKPEKITLHCIRAGGGFGRRGESDFAIEAILIARELAGRPVKVTWTREDDLRHDFFRPRARHSLRAALTPDGMLHAWSVDLVGTSINAIKEGDDCQNPEAYMLAGGGAGDFPYAVPHLRSTYRHVPSRVPRGYWRGVETPFNVFAVEAFIDELARAAKKDLVAFRLDHLARKAPVTFAGPTKFDDFEGTYQPTRLAATLALAAEKANWGQALPAGQSRGVACFPYLSIQAYVAIVVELSVLDGEIRYERVVCAVDCGVVLNPLGARAQCEGGIIFALSALTDEAVDVENGQIKQSNYHDYPLLRFAAAPRNIEVHFVTSAEAPGGVGELPVAPVGPAVANALFAATGRRTYRLPLSRSPNAGKPNA